MDLEKIKKLHNSCQEQEHDLYSYLEKTLPELDIEERLKVMASILNEYLDEYEYNQKDKLKRQDYSITKFFPKK
ncbi:hypothetical protein [Nitratiruptor sp. YY09-18]|uniref:hypothetical protein n=1 Tax=Nitratiruptor sp. YY09-18 TaxID=2724901 RepID=UPI0019164E3F|nr:hypothetical protein [Nitratiruptor sp. YY09-18]BCD68780.1 hypothetical protein NitYY0918_C1697 [Nitratiruptor sp. YY09-18]